jgi:hypothetical protein
MHDVPPKERYALAFHKKLWNVFFVLKKPRSEHVSDEAMHGWLCDVPNVNLSKGAPSAGGPARTWNSQATDER